MYFEILRQCDYGLVPQAKRIRFIGDEDSIALRASEGAAQFVKRNRLDRVAWQAVSSVRIGPSTECLRVSLDARVGADPNVPING
jgi:hypothetical protein